MVRSFGVREEEPVSESSVEVRHVVEEPVLVVIHDLFLEGASEAFRVGVHVRGTGKVNRCKPPLKAPWQGPRGIDNTVWDTVPAQHGKRPHQKGRCDEVLSPVATPNP